MIHVNAEFWNNHQLYVLQVLNVKETNPTRKALKKLAKAEMSQHNLRMLGHNEDQKIELCRDNGFLCRDIA